MQENSIQQVLKQAQTTLTDVSTESALEASVLLQHILDVNRAWLIGHQNDALEANQYAAFEALLRRRLRGEPIAHILGYREFYGLRLKTTPDTLIPRPDTETLVETALKQIPYNQAYHIADLGTGSGAVALAIAYNRPNVLVTAVDASESTLLVAIENAKVLQIENVEFIQSDWLANLQNEKFNMIVSNPPYIAENDAHLKQGDLPWEPIAALVSGPDGMDAIRHIISQALQCLCPQGWLMLEHGYDQAEKVAQLMQQAGLAEITHVQDLAGITRVTLGMMME